MDICGVENTSEESKIRALAPQRPELISACKVRFPLENVGNCAHSRCVAAIVSQIPEETSVLQEEIQKRSVIRSICERQGGGTRLLSLLQFLLSQVQYLCKDGVVIPIHDVPLISHFPEGTENCGRPTGPAFGQGSRFHGSAAFPCS